MITADTTQCPACLDGRVWESCLACDGSGFEDDAPCSKCDGAGEIRDMTPCTICNGTGEISSTLAALMYADRFTRLNAPDWTGNSAEHPGITLYSLADYYRSRDSLRHRVCSMRAVRDEACFGVVELFDLAGQTLVLYTGFAWGYGGEGPTGLATLLCDLGAFETRDGALTFVARQPGKSGWQLAWGEVAS